MTPAPRLLMDPKQRFGFGSIYALQDGRAISSHLMTQQSDNQLKIGLWLKG